MDMDDWVEEILIDREEGGELDLEQGDHLLVQLMSKEFFDAKDSRDKFNLQIEIGRHLNACEEILDGDHEIFLERSEENIEIPAKSIGFSPKFRDSLTLFYVHAAEMAIIIVDELIDQLIISQEYSSSSKTEKLINRLSNYEKEQLLLRTGTISNETHENLASLRKRRNEVVHSSWMPDIERTKEDLQEIIEEDVDTLNKLNKKVENMALFGN